jgi:iron complex outermembrane receptor protein
MLRKLSNRGDVKDSKKSIWSLSLAGVALSAFCVVSAAHAQDNAADASQAEGTGLQDIIVTAQKRSQNVQDTPVSITAVSAIKLEAAGVREIADMRQLDPTLNIGQATGIVTTFIRGIGNPVTTAGNEASVPIYIDDVYYVRPAGPFLDLANIERIEVLKGPQGTLFGRNASGGVVSIYTRDPDFDASHMQFTLGYGNYSTVDAKAYVSTPIGDRVAGDFSISYHNQMNGWGKNLATGEDTWRGKYVSMRSKIVADISDTTKIKLIGYYENTPRMEQGLYGRCFQGKSFDAAGNRIPTGVCGTPNGANEAPPVPTPAEYGAPRAYTIPGFYNTSNSLNPVDKSEGYGGSVRIDQELGFADVTSITAYRKANESFHTDGDATGYNWKDYLLNIRDRQFSQELQLKSKGSSKTSWILGVYYLNADQGFASTDFTGTAFALNGIQRVTIVGLAKIKSYAAFGQITYPVTDDTNITGGLRYTIDKNAGVGSTTATFLPPVAALLGVPSLIVQSDEFAKTNRKLTYKIAADHHFSSDVMVYASYSRGYKAGTYNTLPLDAPSLEPEVVDAYEVGAKTELFDRRVRLNGALFWNDISNPQVLSQRNALVFLTNAKSARTKGVELSVDTSVARGLTLSLGGSYLDARYRDFKDAPFYAYQNATAANPVGNGFILLVPGDASGRRMPYASKWKGNASLDYQLDLADAGKLAFSGSVTYASEFSWEPNGQAVEPAHTLVNASVSFTPSGSENLTIRFWIKNITKEKYNVAEFTQGSGAAFSSAVGAPRMFGGELGVKF